MRRSGTGGGGGLPGGLVAEAGGFGYIQIVAPGGEIESRPYTKVTGVTIGRSDTKKNTEKHI